MGRVELIDTHCHLDVSAFDPDRRGVLEGARRAGVVAIVVPGIHAEGWEGLLRLCADAPDLYPALGLHPVYLDCHRASHLERLRALLQAQRPVAVGEIGLDYFVRDADPAQQQALFEAQLSLAAEAGLPVLLHVRKAHDEVLATLRRIPVPGGIAHAFSGSLQQGFKYVDLGFKLGFGGMLTFERSRKLRALARGLPADSLVLETDAPDLTVARHRGERNSPEYLPDCLAALAEARGEDPAEVAARTTRNAREALGLG
jgi:TatD DNase family protein